jgi:signal transduction histidine kinase
VNDPATTADGGRTPVTGEPTTALVASVDLLAAQPVFAGVTRDCLAGLLASVQPVALRHGEVLVAEGEPRKGFFVLVDGGLLVTKRADGHDLPAGRHRAPSFLGEVPLLTDTVAPVTVRAAGQAQLLHLDDAAFFALLAADRAFARTVFRTTAQRVTGLETFVRGREKMASLGTLAAGLAHELNNPAAAVASAAERLATLARELDTLAAALHAGCESPDALAALAQLRAGMTAASAASPLEEGARDDAFADRLEAHGLEGGWKLGPLLAATSLTLEQLDKTLARFDPAGRASAVRWLATMAELDALVDTTRRGSGRIAELVRAMKSYAYMDQGPRQSVDLHDGLEDTLTILRHKLKHGVEVVRDYDRALPRIPVYGSELNQVWTNLIDNAVDAMDGHGTLTLVTRREGDHAVVEVRDSGNGIAPEIVPRLFEPFFTTKPVGKGTGLGLEIVWRIVTNRHGGRVRVDSAPGDTRFVVSLPIAGA